MRERARDLTALHAHVQKQSPGRVLRPRHPPAAHRGSGPGHARARRGDHPRNERHPRRRRHHRPRGHRARLPDVAKAGPGLDLGKPRARRGRSPADRPPVPCALRGPAGCSARALGTGSAVQDSAGVDLDRLQGRPLRRPTRAPRDGRPAPAAPAGHRAALGGAGPPGQLMDRRRHRLRRGGHRDRGGWGGGGAGARRARTRGGLRRGRAALSPPQLRREHGARPHPLLPAGVQPGEREHAGDDGTHGGWLHRGQRRDRLPDAVVGARSLVRGDGDRRLHALTDGALLRARRGASGGGSGVAALHRAARRGDAAGL